MLEFTGELTGLILHGGGALINRFLELYQHIFQPLEAVILDNTVESQLAILEMYKNLLRHWTVLLQSSKQIPSHGSNAISALVQHVNPLALTLAQTSPTVSTRSSVIEFYESTIRLIHDDTMKSYVRIELPPPMLVYILLFSTSLAVTSRLCYLLARYKKGFETAMSTKARNDGSARIDMTTYNKAYVNLYNGFLMDICNLFWRSRAFGDTDTNSHGCMVPRPIVPALTSYVTSVDKSFSLASIFGLSYAPALCLLSIQKVREMEDSALEAGQPIRTRHAGPVTQNSLARLESSGGLQLSWQNYRISVLETLSAKEFVGITELLKNTMTVLRNSLEGRLASTSRSSQ